MTDSPLSGVATYAIIVEPIALRIVDTYSYRNKFHDIFDVIIGTQTLWAMGQQSNVYSESNQYLNCSAAWIAFYIGN